MTLRVNLQRHTREQYLALLADAGLQALPGTLSPAAVYLQQAVAVDALPGFAQGAVSVQDESAQVAALLLQAQPGERILDACAAPGGKTCHLLELQPDLELVAVDNDSTRLPRVAQNLQRLQLRAELLCMDAAEAGLRWGDRPFDRILLDAPCSASGVIRRHPDIKLLREAADGARFAHRQQALLTGLWAALKPGGLLLYVTCSLLEQENAQVIEAFAAAHAGQLEHSPLELKNGLRPGGPNQGPGLQLLPDVNGGDGLYYAALRKL
jgi:16S rRNA (cytosine967-C5)-methyltransferase